jgi:uncharacterized membrane protein required for colicin V production
MVSLTVVFWMYVVLFAIIGAMRGWAKELMVTFSVVLSLFIVNLLEQFVPPLREGIGVLPRFWVRMLLVTLLVFFGYQTPNIRAIAGARFARERLQDVLLGLIIGALNGYLVVGSLWYFMDEAGYPFAPFFTAPNLSDPMGQAAEALISRLPPVFLQPPWIYFAVAVAFLFVVVVFI